MDKREKLKLAIVFLLILMVAAYMDIKDVAIKKNGTIKRNSLGEDERIIELEIKAEDILDEYTYELVVEPQKVTEEAAKKYIEQAKKQIDIDFKNIKDQVIIKDFYIADIVEAEWSFDPTGIISSEGKILEREISKNKVLINAQVWLRCGTYEELYVFPLEITKDSISRENILLGQINEYMAEQMKKEGVDELVLPKSIDGINITWTEKEDYLTVKIILLEALAGLLIVVSKKKTLKEREEKKRRSMEVLYPDIVNHLSILLEAGMTSRQAWQRMALQYTKRPARGLWENNLVYEAIIHMNRRFSEGESERRIYEMFMKEVDVLSYRRLMRMMINNLGKGSKDLCAYLDVESKRAYDERILLAKKQGEEASTKMLIPLMLMMILVMFIVIVPAIIGFSI